MNLKALNKSELDQRMKSLAQRERDLLYEVLLTIKEIECRRTYLDLGFASLFDYLVQGIGYSEGSAQRRIDAARLIRDLPEVAERIQSGELKLNQISLVQKAAREVFKTQSTEVSAQEKLEALESLANKNHHQSQQYVAAIFNLPVLQCSQQKTQADESVRIELTLSKEAFATIKKAQELLSHSFEAQDLGLFIEFLADKVIKQKTTLKTTATVAVNPEPPRPSMNTTRQLRMHQDCCQYVDPITGRKCQSKWRLQIDHKQSRWAGGSHHLENLQLLCAGHNKLKYRNEVGVRYLT